MNRIVAVAPLTALLVSFAVAYLLGVVLDEDLTRIRFVADGAEPAEALAGADVEVLALTDRTTLATGRLDPSATLRLSTPAGPFRVCLTLPDGWRAPDGMVVDDRRCWARTARDTDVDLTVHPPVVRR